MENINIKELRQRLGLRVEELAVRLEVSPATIWAWEAGKRKPGRLARKQIVRLERKVAKKQGV